MVRRIVRQRAAALRAVAGCACTACATFTAGVVPYAGGILCRFGRACGRGRRGGHLRRRCGVLRILGMECLVVYEGRAASRAIGLCRAAAAFAAFGADVMFYAASCRCGRGRRHGCIRGRRHDGRRIGAAAQRTRSGIAAGAGGIRIGGAVATAGSNQQKRQERKKNCYIFHVETVVMSGK